MKPQKNWGCEMFFGGVGLVAGCAPGMTESDARAVFTEQTESAHVKAQAFWMDLGGNDAKIQLVGPRGKVIAEMIPRRA